MKIPPGEKVLVDFLFAEYPALEKYRSADRFNLKKEKQILEIIDTEENKKKYHEWIELRNQRGAAGSQKEKVVKEKVVKEKVIKEKEDKEKEKISVKEKVKNIEKKVSDNAEKEKKISDSNQVKRMKIQRDNMEKKLNKVNEDKVELKAEIEGLKEDLEDLKLINTEILKDYKKERHEREKLNLFCEGKGWKKSKVDEFNRYKETYQKCVCGAKD